MWVISTVPTLRPSSCPPNFFSTTTAKSATTKFRGGRWRCPKNDYGGDTSSASDDEEGEGEIGVVNTAVQSSGPVLPKRPIVSSDHHHLKHPLKGEETEPRGRRLSGSDVIWALQRATAHKNNTLNYTSSSSSALSKSTSARSSNTNTIKRQEEDDGNNIYNNNRKSNAIPFCIKSEWTTQLDELDKRLHHLLDSVDL